MQCPLGDILLSHQSSISSMHQVSPPFYLSSRVPSSPLAFHPFPVSLPLFFPPIPTIAISQLRPLLHSPNLQPLLIFLQHTLIMVFPELLRRILSRYSLQYLGSAWMLIHKPCHKCTSALFIQFAARIEKKGREWGKDGEGYL
jgi:hypothetical protein